MNVDCPALHHRAGDYPTRFCGAIPKTIVAAENVQSEIYQYTLSPLDASLRVVQGQRYPAWTNSHGAVCAVLPDGRKLGLKPDEFQVVEWHGINVCPGCHLPSGEDASFCTACGRQLFEQIELDREQQLEAVERMRKDNDERIAGKVGSLFLAATSGRTRGEPSEKT